MTMISRAGGLNGGATSQIILIPAPAVMKGTRLTDWIRPTKLRPMLLPGWFAQVSGPLGIRLTACRPHAGATESSFRKRS